MKDGGEVALDSLVFLVIVDIGGVGAQEDAQ